jgi:RHS repeat-associated protein
VARADSAAYTYSPSGLLSTVTDGSGGAGNVTWGTVDSSVPEVLTDGTWAYIYGPAGPVEQVNLSSGTPYWLYEDVEGSVRVVTDGSGAVAGTADYGPYGKVSSVNGVTSNLGWQGQWTDPESGLVYMRERWYDPITGQFVSVDPLVAVTGQPYEYAGDDSVNASDPSGLITVGFCTVVGASLLGPSGFGSGCLTRTVSGGKHQIGVVGTIGGGGAQSISVFAQGSEEVTNATSLDQLRGPFAYFLVNVGDLYGGSVIVFIGKGNIFGVDVGGGFSVNLAKGLPIAPFTIGGGVDNSYVAVFHHFWETIPARLAWDAESETLGQPPVNDLLNLAEYLLDRVKSSSFLLAGAECITTPSIDS